MKQLFSELCIIAAGVAFFLALSATFGIPKNERSTPTAVAAITVFLESEQPSICESGPAKAPWYGGGLRFTCTQCGNCCTGPQGYVWISTTEIHRLAKHLKISTDEVIDKYCRRIGKRFSLKEHRNSRGEYDCTFLKEVKTPAGDGSQVVHSRRVCTIYEYRPLQCRTWPFWDGNLSGPAAWNTRAPVIRPAMRSGTMSAPVTSPPG